MADEDHYQVVIKVDEFGNMVRLTDEELGRRWRELVVIDWMPGLSSEEEVRELGMPVDDVRGRLRQMEKGRRFDGATNAGSRALVRQRVLYARRSP